MKKKHTIKPFFAYAGGKSTMAKHILPLIPPHICYTEPFFGSGIIFWRKEQAKVSVINDLNDYLINFWKCLLNNYDELYNMLRGTLYSRSEYEKAAFIRLNQNDFNNVERAWSFFIIHNQGFGGSGRGTGWGYSKTVRAIITNAYFNRVSNLDSFKDVILNRLRDVQIECRPANKVIEVFDSTETFHYIDPPYVNTRHDGYSVGIKRKGFIDGKGRNGSCIYDHDDLVELLELCATLKGKFMLCHYNNETIKEYANKHNWKVKEITRGTTMGNPLNNGRVDNKKIELIVMNYNNDLF